MSPEHSVTVSRTMGVFDRVALVGGWVVVVLGLVIPILHTEKLRFREARDMP